ncbi:hypothetical protein [Citrobacter freundii]|uniref:hypothetical protein n=1 Tax=Citrobacter freundii TaxID=546 RepID=UPI001BCB48AF|nr:hypothetical protein [Citrobacter freundii]MDU7723239.1 hypothetical protein [Citrobacter sp.]MDU1356022.1 hypothetical protein [Citrobacter freundii]MDU1700503.1 hypothetical protein [Citrobacter freundii]MDU1733872.1 hypothetical protein [Citrobacter freundii]MDU1816844.1 hypothetical protein [Citrobacter freundii]
MAFLLAQEGKAMEKEESFENAVKPLIKWLNENTNPHAVIVVEVGGAVLYSGEQSVVTDEFIKG